MMALFDWLVIGPAKFVDYLLLCALGFAAFVPPVLAWHWTIKLMEPTTLRPQDFPGAPSRPLTWITAFAISTYVFLVCGAAVYELPRVYHAMFDDENPN
jgi:hypothetical protein